MKKGQLESHVLVLVTLALVAFGLVMVYSATSAPAALSRTDPMSYLKKQGGYALFGVVLMVLASRFDYRKLRLFAPALVLTALAGCFAVLVIGTRINGARRWIELGPATFQPSELAKLAMAVWAASYLCQRPAPRTLRELWRPIGLLLGLFCLLILAEPDLGTAIALVLVLLAVLVVSGTPASTLAAAGSIAVALGLLAIWFEPYRRARIFSFLDPWKDPQGAGFQTVQALISLGSGGWFGVGLGQGVAKINYLPEAHTDMILGVIGEELGLVGVAAVLAAFVAFAWAGLRVALICKDPFGKRLAVGVVALVSGQAVINLAAVLGLAPLTGIPLPFISYGGSSLVVTLLGVGSSLTSPAVERGQQLRCLIAAGGTAGHVAPSLAVAEALQRRGVHVTFAGSPDRIEARLVPEAGYELDTFRISGLPRRPSPALARALLLAGRAPRACAQILRARRPDVVLGGGGYVAGPMVYAAFRQRVPTALMEADAHLGLANRLAAPFARRVFLSFPIAGREGEKYQVTGRPIPARSRAVPQPEARRVFGLPAVGPVLLVFGGSLGAALLNDVAFEGFGAAGPAVLHLSGTRDYDRLAPHVTRPDYRLFAFTEEFGAALGASDVVLARAGGSVWELAAAGKPAVLIPGSFATGDHQTKNAEFFERAGAAVVVPEREAGRAPDVIRSLLDDPQQLEDMSRAMLRIARPGAADEIAEELIALAT